MEKIKIFARGVFDLYIDKNSRWPDGRSKLYGSGDEGETWMRRQGPDWKHIWDMVTEHVEAHAVREGEKERAKKKAQRKGQDPAIVEQLIMDDQALQPGTAIYVSGYGPGEYVRFDRKWQGENDHTIRFDAGGIKTLKLKGVKAPGWAVTEESIAAMAKADRVAPRVPGSRAVQAVVVSEQPRDLEPQPVQGFLAPQRGQVRNEMDFGGGGEYLSVRK